MTINDIIKTLEEIPARDRDRNVSICGSKIENKDTIDDFIIEWMDCSNSILLFVNQSNQGEQNKWKII